MNSCTVELFADECWNEIARVSLHATQEHGWQAASMTIYEMGWAVDHMGARDAYALCSGYPVSLELLLPPHWPVFLLDMLPQGFGRGELLRQLNLPETMTAAADWRLLQAGAGNPIGHLRIKEAAAWLQDHTGPRRGFTEEEVAQRSDGFMDHLGTHGLFVAGSSGVQGEWPKLLLTRAHDGLLYLDHSVNDADAVEHFIVKFGRGSNKRLAQILRHEAAYMAIAGHLGLRVHAPLRLRERALFIPRFDRKFAGKRLIRLAQESIATLTGMPGFGAVPSHDQVCRALAETCTDPQAEILEYIKRDVANLALTNKDNHARNTAVQRDFAGRIALTPVFEFAPMYLHPDGIARRTRWEADEGGRPDWRVIADTVSRDCELNRAALVDGMRRMAPRLEAVARDAAKWRLEPDVHAFVAPHVTAQAKALRKLK